MAQALDFTKVALVVGILSTAEEKRERLLSLLEEKFGKIKKISEQTDFNFTDYYDSEMGGRPVRYVILFENLVSPDCLAKIKIETNNMEKEFCDKDNNRKINIDPGLLSLSGFVLASCKNRSHRIALSDGVYAETTLIYQNKDFIRLPWTYEDWASDKLREILRSFRQEYRQMLKSDLILN